MKRLDPAQTRLHARAMKRPKPARKLLDLSLIALLGGLALPGALGKIVKMLADAATPVALFTIGTVLWRARQHAHTRTPAAQFVPVALFKLFVHPLLVLAVGLRFAYQLVVKPDDLYSIRMLAGGS